MENIAIRIESVPSSIQLDESCWSCGRKPNPECAYCSGIGFITTADGDAILDFVRRHLKSTATVEYK